MFQTNFLEFKAYAHKSKVYIAFKVAGPLGFEPRISGSAGQRPNPY